LTAAWRAAGACLALWLAALSAGAAPLELSVAPVLGTDAPSDNGWFTYVVRLENRSSAAIAGTLSLESDKSGSTRAPFALGAGQRAFVQLAWHDLFTTTLTLKAVDSEGSLLAKLPVRSPRNYEPLLFDLTVPSRLGTSLKGSAIPLRPRSPSPLLQVPMLGVTSPAVDERTGALLLPTRAAGYASATLVLADSRVLAQLEDSAVEALARWALAGGTLAVVPTRPEDLRGSPLEPLIGGPAVATAPESELRERRYFVVPREPPIGSSPTTRKRVAPSDTVQAALASYTGGNLRPTRWGSAATYGLGEVHLLAFDPAQPSVVMDEWVQLSLVDLVRHAAERRVHIALSHGAQPLVEQEIDHIRRVLDPNEGMRWAVVVSAVLLLLYALIAGPLSFNRAMRSGRPLRALWQLPLWAAGTLVLVVIAGVVAKGGRGRARHLTLVESGAGMTTAAATRFRAFFASSADTLTVQASGRDSVLDVAGDASSAERSLVVDRDGARLEDFVTRPWETVVVREDGFIQLGGGVTLARKGDSDVLVKNRLARDLVGALLWLPQDGTLRYFDRIADGAVVTATAGRRLALPTSPYPAAGLNALGSHAFAPTVEKASAGLGAAWQALDSLVGPVTDWWPPDVPVLLAQVDGGEGRTSDAGLPLDIDRVLLRVVGYGGTP
jgi:hypothetical protein